MSPDVGDVDTSAHVSISHEGYLTNFLLTPPRCRRLVPDAVGQPALQQRLDEVVEGVASLLCELWLWVACLKLHQRQSRLPQLICGPLPADIIKQMPESMRPGGAGEAGGGGEAAVTEGGAGDEFMP